MFAVLDSPSLNAAAGGSTGSTKKCCWPSCAAAPPRWAGIAIGAPAADTRPPSPTTRAATGIAQDARATRADAGFSRVFRGKFVAGLRNAFHRGDLQFHGSLAHLAQPRAFAAWLRILFRHDWVVYSKRPFGGPEHVLCYLGAHTHRVAISNSRLVALSGGNVTFRWRDSAHGNKKRLMPLAVDEFLRRFLLHLLPPGFVRIRSFGFLANRNRASLLPLCS